eukprot:TRINITY_DN34685_c0_g1_i1.p1 TRINITY_DN34685_c0_g1~~TRINITY_DN34685_c0_g1_i1.p1  ORF type:complete len:741 (-),score=167.66 TRINITY_DN34685_c0_g1_i1:168-2390(-)
MDAAAGDAQPSSQKRPTLLRQCFGLATPLLQTSGKACAWLGAALVLTVGESGVLVAFSYRQKSFTTAIANSDLDGFWLGLYGYLQVLSVAAPLFAIASYAEGRLSREWRAHMTRHFLGRYFANRNYYSLTLRREDGVASNKVAEDDGADASNEEAAGSKSVDNPDQRLLEDTQIVSSVAVHLLLGFVRKVVNVASFSGVLYSISPGLLVFAVGYSAFGSLVAESFLTPKLRACAAAGLRFDADVRFRLVRLRQHAEEVAFLRGEKLESAIVSKAFDDRLAMQDLELKWRAALDIFQNTFQYLTSIIPYIVVAPAYFRGEMEFGVISQTAMAFMVLRGGLGFLVSESARIGRLGASAARIHELTSQLDLCEHTSLGDEGPGDDFTIPEEEVLDVSKLKADAYIGRISTRAYSHAQMPQISQMVVTHNLDIFTPSRSVAILENLSLALAAGDSLLVFGPSGIGKTSLLRVLAGLWHSGSGIVERPSDDLCRFIPQRPYLPLGGSLRDQLLYPHGQTLMKALDDEALAQALEKCAAGHLLRRLQPSGGLDVRFEQWEGMLSLGEQQRLAFARIVLKPPSLVLLDEGSSAMDEASEAACYSALRAACPTYVSVGHRKSLLRYHDWVLCFDPPETPDGPCRTRLVRAEDYARKTRPAGQLKALQTVEKVLTEEAQRRPETEAKEKKEKAPPPQALSSLVALESVEKALTEVQADLDAFKANTKSPRKINPFGIFGSGSAEPDRKA